MPADISHSDLVSKFSVKSQDVSNFSAGNNFPFFNRF